MPDADAILAYLDAVARSGSFPHIGNGYFSAVAARLSAHRSADDWALVFETFGFVRDQRQAWLSVRTFGSRPGDGRSDEPADATIGAAGERAAGPYDRHHRVDPIQGPWIGPDARYLAGGVHNIRVRGQEIEVPVAAIYADRSLWTGVDTAETLRVCRWLARHHRDAVLASREERRRYVPPDLEEVLILDDWNHPDGLPGSSADIRALTRILAGGAANWSTLGAAGNTHWSQWADEVVVSDGDDEDYARRYGG